MQTSDEDEEESRRQIQMLSAFIDTMINIIPLLPAPKKKRKKRIAKVDLPYHKRRRRVNWHQWVRELGPEDFYRHHRMTRDQIEKLLTYVRGEIVRDVKKCRYGSGPVTPRMQLTITLKHLGGDSTHDIEKHMGGTFCVVIIDNDCSGIHTLHICIVRCSSCKDDSLQNTFARTGCNCRQIGHPTFPPRRSREVGRNCNGFQEQIRLNVSSNLMNESNSLNVSNAPYPSNVRSSGTSRQISWY